MTVKNTHIFSGEKPRGERTTSYHGEGSTSGVEIEGSGEEL